MFFPQNCSLPVVHNVVKLLGFSESAVSTIFATAGLDSVVGAAGEAPSLHQSYTQSRHGTVRDDVASERVTHVTTETENGEAIRTQ